MNNLTEYKLVDICSKIGSGATPRGGGDTYLKKGEYSLIRSQNVLDFQFSTQGLAYISLAQAEKLNNVKLEERDVLLNITGDSVARVCQVPCNILPARVNQHVAIIRPNVNFLIPEYLKYYLLNPVFKEYMLMISSSGATRNAITKGMIENFTLRIPDVPTQTAIVEILSSLDNKIEINNKINQELEELAQTLFKKWFIDFEFPDENGQPYKSSGGEMIISELGEIPKGWEIKRLGDIILRSHTGADAITRAPIVDYDTGIRCARVGDMTNKRPYQEWAFCKITSEDYSRQKLDLDDIIVTRTATLGINLIIRQEIAAVCNNGLIRLKINKQKCTPLFVYIQLQSENYKTYIDRISGDSSTRPNMQMDYLLSYNILLPNSELIDGFVDLLKDNFEAIDINISESMSLTNLRDTLLPKLVSGELDISGNLNPIVI